MDALSRLVALDAIARLKARYCYHLDHREWDAWQALFADDAVLDVSAQYPDAPDPAVHVTRGAAAIVAGVRAALGATQTVHHVHAPILSVDGPDAASGSWALADRLFLPDGTRMTGWGHYHERYRRIGGEWRIAATRLTRLRVELVAAGREDGR